jgi:hypothetical protein
MIIIFLNPNSWDGNLNEVLMQHYQASEFLAMAGKHLIPQKTDDSNRNFGFDSDKGMFIGHELSEGERLGLHLENLELQLLDPSDRPIARIGLTGKTTSQVLFGLKQVLHDKGIDVSNLKHELHYDLLEHSNLHNGMFSVDESEILREIVAQRHNAMLVLAKVIAEYASSVPIRRTTDESVISFYPEGISIIRSPLGS